ncbi:MAG: efflux RND transporter periplasmic adaptor subunit, partial [Balneolales bacterium]|nr:efflux RND transporter periplasmic adaptor subunit [Balneolales bacterium]
QRKREFVRDSTLNIRGLVSPHQYETSLQQYEQVRLRRDLFAEQLALDSAATESELNFIAESLVNMERNLNLVSQILDNLVIRAPIDGMLTSLDAEIGETKSAGQRIGQIDVLDGYKLRAQIDEVYITRIDAGQRAAFDFAGTTHELMITRLYPEVVDGRFQVDLDFTGTIPESLRRGQSVRLRVFFSEDEEALVIPRGSFFQQTAGNWIFVVDANGASAERRNIRIGRQNAQFYVIEEGLQPGDQVVTSSYEGFANHSRLNFR